MLKEQINDKAKKDFLIYANAVIKSRAISKIEDNLKPVHRRILYTLAENKIWSNKNTVKCAKVVGLILAYHPHGDSAVYQTLVRLAQPWKMRYPLISMQGNAGSILGDGPAAMRYTECKLSPIGELMLDGISDGAVDFKPNYDETSLEPIILPSRFPNILANGNTGIAVGMSSSLVPHNINGVVKSIVAFLDNKDIKVYDLAKIILGPDFPTGGTIIDGEKLANIYATGSGTITVRCKYDIENYGRGQQMIRVTEVPYLVNIREGIVEPLQKLVLEENFNLIEDIQNDTNKDGVDVKIILKKGANIYKVLEVLWAKTRLQVTQRVNNTVIVDGNPKTLNLKELIEHFLAHRHNVIINIAQNDLDKTEKRMLIVKALLIALARIDEVIKLIKESVNRSAAKSRLMSILEIDDVQANAILDMKLSRLSKLDGTELITELDELQKKKEVLLDIISNVKTRENLIKVDLLEIQKLYGDKRKTIVRYYSGASAAEDVEIEETNVLVLQGGEIYATKDKIENIGIDKRGSIFNKKPILSIATLDNDKKLTIFTKEGLMFHQNVITMSHDMVEGSEAIGQPLAALDLSIYDSDTNLIFITSDGLAKKSSIDNYTTARSGSASTRLRGGDSLIYVGVAKDDDYVFILGKKGKLVKFKVSEISSTGRMTLGAKGISDEAVSAATGTNNDKIFMINDKGQAKITLASELVDTARASAGQVIADGTVHIANMKKGYIITYFDGKNNIIKSDTLSVKNKGAVGAKILNSNIEFICN